VENEAFGIKSCGKVLRRSEGIKGYINERGGRGDRFHHRPFRLRQINPPALCHHAGMDRGEVVYLGKKAVWGNDSGSIQYASPAELKEIRSQYGLVFQNFNLFPHFSVMKNITDAPIHVQKRNKEEVYSEARELLKKMGLEDKEDAYPYQLSGGQCQRVAIARALALKPRILFFDEPTSALDPELTGEVLKVIRSLADLHIAMVIVTHEMAFARDISHRVVFMAGGVIVEEGTPEEVFSSDNERTQSFLGRYGTI
jgi:polar amino acid transport system ATP-binding protein